MNCKNTQSVTHNHPVNGVKTGLWVPPVMLLGCMAFYTGPMYAAGSITEALTSGSATVNIRARYENHDQDGVANTGEALTVRTRLGYGTGEFNGFSVYGEFEDVTVIGDEDYNSAVNGNTAYAVIADPEDTEVNQAYIGFSGLPDTMVKYGLQRIIYDNARFVGNVGWRQNEQTYKAFSLSNSHWDNTSLSYANLSQIHTITGGETDVDAHLLNASYSGLTFGKVTAYGYFVEFPDMPTSTRTLGLRMDGAQDLESGVKLLYTVEYAKQSDYKDGDSAIDADYTFLELGANVSGIIAKVGYEVLGADDYSGFETPLATKHAFNGWADKFLNTPTDGLEDLYFLATTKLGGVKLLAVYHDYSADKGGADYGDEWGLLAVKKFGKHYDLGFKYASYDADTHSVDSDKLWLWGTISF